MRSRLVAACTAAACVAAGCVCPSADAKPLLVDVTGATGITFLHANGATGLKDYRETMGSGVCLFDYDGDGRQDVYLVTCVGPNRLFRNVGGLRFEDVTEAAGVGSETYDMGAVAADIDNDGDADLLVTSLRANRFYVNRGDGTFREDAARVGLDDTRWGCGAAFFDADRDGFLDLYVANYVEVADPDTNECFGVGGRPRLICKPTDYPAASDVFFHNRGDGTFEQATEAFGFHVPAGRGLGVVATDTNRDGAPDVYVANDLDPNLFFENRGDGTFEETGFFSGTSHSEDGRAESGMGVAVGDYDNDGWPDLFVTNFVGQSNTLYHNEGDGFFQDETAAARLGRPSLVYVGWGTGFVDFDGDGRRDLFVVNGHVEPDAARVNDPVGWRQPDLLFRNEGDGTFRDVTGQAAPGFAEPYAGRGAAVGDLDDDGDPEIVVVNQNGPARVFENLSNPEGWIGFRLRGTASNRDGIGARVELHAGEETWTREAVAGGSFLSAQDTRLLFGLGMRAAVDSVVVHWPSGKRSMIPAPATGRYHVLEEGG